MIGNENYVAGSIWHVIIRLEKRARSHLICTALALALQRVYVKIPLLGA